MLSWISLHGVTWLNRFVGKGQFIYTYQQCSSQYLIGIIPLSTPNGWDDIILVLTHPVYYVLNSSKVCLQNVNKTQK